MKKIFLVLLLVSLLLVLPSCSGSNEKTELLNQLDNINKSCPYTYENFTLQSATLQDNEIKLEFTSDSAIFFFKELNVSPDKLKRLVASNVFEYGELSRVVGSTDYDVSLNFKGPEGFEDYQIQFSNQEVKDLIAKPFSDEDMLDLQVEINNISLPLQVDEASTLVKIVNDKDFVSFIYEIDGDVDFNQLEADIDEFKQNIAEGIKLSISDDTQEGTVIELTQIANKDVHYEYRDKHTQQKMVVTFTNAELYWLVNNL